MKHYPYEQKRVYHDEQSWSDVSIVECSADKLQFDDVPLLNMQMRLRDASHLRYVKAQLYGQDNPVIVAWACLEADQSASYLFPDVNAITDDGEILFSANSLITYTMKALLKYNWLFYEEDQWQLDIPQHLAIWQQRASQILDWLKINNRILIYTHPDYIPTRQDFVDFPIQRNAIALGRAGFLRQAVAENAYQIAFNASYFLLETDDFISYHSALGDPYNLLISAGIVKRPPLYKRAMLGCTDNGKWFVDVIGLEDIHITIGDYHLSNGRGDLQFSINPETADAIAIYTRYFGVESTNQVLGYTPITEGRIEFTVIDQHIVSMKENGNLEIPQNGLILSFSEKMISSDIVEHIKQVQQVSYDLAPRFESLQHAIQCGPMLLQNSQLMLEDSIFTREQFWISRDSDEAHLVGVVPTDYPIDINTVRAGRMVLGIKEDNSLLVVAVAGVNSGFDLNNTDSAGATLMEMVEHLRSAGAVSAINLDGGGSTQLFLSGGAMTRSGDRRGLLGIIYDRMIPTAGFVL